MAEGLGRETKCDVFMTACDKLAPLCEWVCKGLYWIGNRLRCFGKKWADLATGSDRLFVIIKRWRYEIC